MVDKYVLLSVLIVGKTIFLVLESGWLMIHMWTLILGVQFVVFLIAVMIVYSKWTMFKSQICLWGIVHFESCVNPHDFSICKRSFVQFKSVDVVYKWHVTLISSKLRFFWYTKINMLQTLILWWNTDKCDQIAIVMLF